MFRGLNSVKIDAKGRLAVPARYREALLAEAEGQLVVTIDTESTCLLLYPSHEWEVIEKKLQALPSFDPTARRIQRLLIGHATDIDIDNQGRILIPPLLRDYAKLQTQAAFVGQGRKFEIWDEVQWQAGRERWLAHETQGAELPQDLQTLSL